MVLFTIVFLWFVGVSCFENCMVLDAESNFTLSWTLRPATIEAEMAADGMTAGYLAISFLPASVGDRMLNDPHGIPNQDAWTAYPGCGSACVYDAIMPEKKLKRDSSDDFTAISVSTDGGRLRAAFERAVDTGHSGDVKISAAAPQRISYVVHKSGSIGSAGPGGEIDMSKHSTTTGVGFNTIKWDATSSCAVAAPSGNGELALGGASDFKLKVVIVGANVQFTVSAATSGWVAMGWAPGPPSHADADFYMCSVAADGTARCDDTSSNSKSAPSVDSPSAVLAGSVSGSETGGVTSVTFERPLAGGAGSHAVVDAPVWFQWAVCSQDSFSTVHSTRGALSLNLMAVAGASNAAPSPPITSAPSPAPTPLDTSGGGSSYASPDGVFSLEWTLVDPQTMEFVARAKVTGGYLAFGWSNQAAPHASMDTYGAWADAGGASTLHTGYSNSKARPQDDPGTGVSLVSLQQVGNELELILRRPLSTGAQSCDPGAANARLDGTECVDWTLTETPVYLYWAAHSSPDFALTHQFAGLGFVRFLGDASAPLVVPPTPAPSPRVLPGGGNGTSGGDGTRFDSPDGDFSLAWAPVADDDQILEFVARAKVTGGYLAFGWSNQADPHVAMDTYGASMGTDGSTPTLYTGYSNGKARPQDDPGAGVTLVGVVQDGEFMEMTLRRSLSTGAQSCDPGVAGTRLDGTECVDWTLTEEPVYLFWAAHSSPNFAETHQKAGFGFVRFLGGALDPSQIMPGLSGGGAGRFNSGDLLLIAVAVVVLGATLQRVVRWLARRTRSEIAATGGHSSPSLQSNHGVNDMHTDQVTGIRFSGAALDQASSLTMSAGDGLDDWRRRATGAAAPNLIYARLPPERPLPSDMWNAATDAPVRNFNPAADNNPERFQGLAALWNQPVSLPPPPTTPSPAAANGSHGGGSRSRSPSGSSRQRRSRKMSASTANASQYGRLPDGASKHHGGRSANSSGGSVVDYGSISELLDAGGQPTSSSYPAPAQETYASLAVVGGPKVSMPRESLGHRLSHLMHKRVPFTQFALGAGLLGATFVLLNAACAAIILAAGGWTTVTAAKVANELGYLASANAVLVIFPATRNSILVWLLAKPFDHTILYHRWLGRWVLLLSVAHLILYLPGWVANDAWSTVFASAKYLYGLLTVLSGIWIGVTSVQWARRRKFQFFYWSHHAFLLFYFFLALHSARYGVPCALVSAGIYVLDRLVRLFWGAWPRRCLLFKAQQGGAVQIRFPRHPLVHYKVGNYCFVNFPSVSLTQWHPFTLASGPQDPHVEIFVKSLGDHTQKLQALAQKLEQQQSSGSRVKLPWIRVDGPYGQFTLPHHRYPTIVLVGGGIGVTPLIACLREIYRTEIPDHRKRSVAKVQHHIKHVFFLWTCPNRAVFSWFEATIAKCLRQAEKPNYPTFHCRAHLTRESLDKNGPAPTGTTYGRPNMSHEFDRVASTASGGGGGGSLDSRRVAVFACGPQPLVTAAWDESVARSVAKPALRIDFHQEIFNF